MRLGFLVNDSLCMAPCNDIGFAHFFLKKLVCFVCADTSGLLLSCLHLRAMDSGTPVGFLPAVQLKNYFPCFKKRAECGPTYYSIFLAGRRRPCGMRSKMGAPHSPQGKTWTGELRDFLPVCSLLNFTGSHGGNAGMPLFAHVGREKNNSAAAPFFCAI